MKDQLPNRPLKNEIAIVNLDSGFGSGTHWVCYNKKGHVVNYFDSFGNLRPPKELLDYFGVDTHVQYNYTNYQPLSTVICGHLCLLFLAAQAVS